jgi:hypothetical protein
MKFQQRKAALAKMSRPKNRAVRAMMRQLPVAAPVLMTPHVAQQELTMRHEPVELALTTPQQNRDQLDSRKIVHQSANRAQNELSMIR